MSTNCKEIGYAIFEDEYITLQFIKKTISSIRPSYKLRAECHSIASIESTISSLKPNFIISGLSLGDGLCTNEYRRLKCHVPKIIYTAYPDLLPTLEGLNVVHTSCKPISIEDVKTSILKIEEVLL